MATLTILHFNDVYNIEGQKDEPQGGAARMKTYINSQRQCNPLVLFSGDALNPSLMSIFLKGNQMVDILNGLNVAASVYGNHDFDFGVDHLEDVAEKCSFPWLLSNVKDIMNNEPLAKGELYTIIEHAGVKIGLIGLVEEEWIDTLSTLDPEDILFVDYVEAGNQLANMLKGKDCDLIIALTHMRVPNDVRLAENVDGIDIVLGGHDHDYEIIDVKGKYVVKSGTDFRNMSKITMALSNNGGWEVKIDQVDLDSSIAEDEEMKRIVSKKLEKVEGRMDVVIGHMNVEMDGRFGCIRTQETNLGNFIAEIMLTATKADVALLNSGTLRSDRIHPKGEFRIKDLLTILPMVDPLVVLKCTGNHILEALENGVSKHPVKEGRFPQVAGLSFGFDPSLPPGHRVAKELVKVHGKYINPTREYRLVTKEFLAAGRDGYGIFKNCEVLESSEECTALSTMIQNHFESVQIYQGEKGCKSGHRQCLLPRKKRDAVKKMLTGNYDEMDSKLVRQHSIHEMEKEQEFLAPKVDGRILLLTEEKRMIMQDLKSEFDKVIVREPSPVLGATEAASK